MNYNIIKSDIEDIKKNLGSHFNNFQYKNILIAGGCGFIGYYLLKTLDKPNIKVTLIDNLSSKNTSTKFLKELKKCKITYYNHDLTRILPTQIRKKEFDLIIHLAGIPSPIYYMASPLKTIDIAINGTRQLLEIAKKNKSKFIFFSSSEIYGDPPSNKIPTSEEYRGNVSTMGPRACYDESKRLAETLCYTYKTKFDVNCNVIRPFNFFGPGMDIYDYRVIPSLTLSALKSKNLKVYGNGKQTRTFCYITDAITGILLTILKGVPGEAYNIGVNHLQEISMYKLANKIIKILKSDSKIDLIPHPNTYPTDDPSRRAPDLSKAFKDLGYKDKIKLNESLTKFCMWAKKNYQ